jgi:hypothetical protein
LSFPELCDEVYKDMIKFINEDFKIKVVPLSVRLVKSNVKKITPKKDIHNRSLGEDGVYESKNI